MANQKNETIKREKALEEGSLHLFAAARDGYNDALEGKGFRGYYDKAPEWYQQNYERGRLWVASFRAIKQAPPVWRWLKVEPIPRVIAKQIEAACRVGDYHSIPD